MNFPTSNFTEANKKKETNEHKLSSVFNIYVENRIEQLKISRCMLFNSYNYTIFNINQTLCNVICCVNHNMFFIFFIVIMKHHFHKINAMRAERIDKRMEINEQKLERLSLWHSVIQLFI